MKTTINGLFAVFGLLCASMALSLTEDDRYITVTGTIEQVITADDGAEALQVVTKEKVYRLHPAREVLHHTPLGRKVQVKGIVEVTEVGEFLRVEELVPIEE